MQPDPLGRDRCFRSPVLNNPELRCITRTADSESVSQWSVVSVGGGGGDGGEGQLRKERRVETGHRAEQEQRTMGRERQMGGKWQCLFCLALFRSTGRRQITQKKKVAGPESAVDDSSPAKNSGKNMSSQSTCTALYFAVLWAGRGAALVENTAWQHGGQDLRVAFRDLSSQPGCFWTETPAGRAAPIEGSQQKRVH